MKFCAKCGASNADSSKFCIECGTALAVENTNADYNYNEVNDNNVVNEDNTNDTSYTYGDASAESSTETAIIDTCCSEKSSAGENDKYSYTYNADNAKTYNSSHPGIGQRNLVLAIILSFVTCGIYQIYWMIKMNDEVNVLADEPNATSGILVFLFTLITCGIYGFIWMYKMGERCDRIKGSVGGSSGILYLILSLLGLGIVSYCLIQDTINKAV